MIGEDAGAFRLTYVLGGDVQLVRVLIEAFSWVVDLCRNTLKLDFQGTFENLDEGGSRMPMLGAGGARSQCDFSDRQHQVSPAIGAQVFLQQTLYLKHALLLLIRSGGRNQAEQNRREKKLPLIFHGISSMLAPMTLTAG
jgi:hypothetical protein